MQLSAKHFLYETKKFMSRVEKNLSANSDCKMVLFTVQLSTLYEILAYSGFFLE